MEHNKFAQIYTYKSKINANVKLLNSHYRQGQQFNLKNVRQKSNIINDGTAIATKHHTTQNTRLIYFRFIKSRRSDKHWENLKRFTISTVYREIYQYQISLNYFEKTNQYTYLPIKILTFQS